MEQTPYLSVVIPTYNESVNIISTLNEIQDYLKSKDFSYEVIVVDDGSTDDTVKKTQALKGEMKDLTIIESVPNKGKGFVLRRGMLEAQGDYVMFMDADNSTSINELEKIIPKFRADCDVCIASRRVPGADVKVPISRRVLGNFYILLSRIILGLKVSDINCGFKVFEREAAREAFSKQIMDDWSFDAEVLFLLNKRGREIQEIPVKWVHKDTSKVRPIIDGINSFTSLLRIKLNDMKGVYRK